MKRMLILMLFILPLLMVACGGGGSPESPTPSSNWDEMVWDQSDWA